MTNTGVDVFYTNQQVFCRDIIRSEIYEWLYDNCGGYDGWYIVDRDPDDGFKGETFQFIRSNDALMFKLTWGGK